jgi:sulfatase modifying factor 1
MGGLDNRLFISGERETPLLSVRLEAFQMGATPVTVAMWKEYCYATGTWMPQTPEWGWIDDHPVVNVSWFDVMSNDGEGNGFCAWASDIAGFQLTLPSEAQFEYAARGGQSLVGFPWGHTFDDSKVWCGRKTTASVSRSTNIFKNSYGLSDMSGNVSQWCCDCEVPLTDSQAEKMYPPSGAGHCYRGGSWRNDDEDEYRCGYGLSMFSDFRCEYIGFRLTAGPG